MRLEPSEDGTTASEIVTESQNISASGVYCQAAHYLAPLSKVGLTIVLPDFGSHHGEMVKCDGVVVRCEHAPDGVPSRPYQLACAFLDLGPLSRELLGKFVTWRNLQALRMAARRAAAPTRRTATRRKPARKTAARRGKAARSGSARLRGSARAAAKRR
jgi:hypothetical protein